MKFSLVFEGDKPLPSYLNYLKLAQKYDFYSLQIYEHLTFKPAWGICFYLASSTEKTRIGPATVPVMAYHPTYIAANAASLSEATGGNALLGISRGAFYEYVSARVEKPLTAVREAVEIVDLLLKGGGRYEGKVFRTPEGARLKFDVGGEIELYVGSSGPKMIQMASGLGPVKGILVDNLWNPHYAKKVRDYIRQGALRSGRRAEEITLMARPFSCVASDAGRTFNIVVEALARYLPFLVSDSPMLREAGVEFSELLEFARKPDTKSETAWRLVENFSATGTPEGLVEQVDKMRRAGVTHVCFGHPLGENVEEAIKLIGERVKPHFDSA